MISPTLSARLNEPSFLTDSFDEHTQDRMGRYLEVVITESAPMPSSLSSSIQHSIPRLSEYSAPYDNYCHLLGILLYELFSGSPPFSSSHDLSIGISPHPHYYNSHHHKGGEPDRKRSTVRYDKKKGKSYSTLQTKPYSPLQELGMPSSICLLVQALIDGHEVYSSLEAASSDMHLLLSNPDCFLFDLGITSEAQQQYGNNNSIMQLQIKKGKLYGREKEVSLITDAFCRVSSGKNEAIFIGGYSGVGKTFLVQCLVNKVDVSGGYVLTQKVDQMSREQPLLEVLSAFNRLCTMIKRKTSPTELLEIANKLMVDFESDFSVLTRLLPNINILFPHLSKLTAKDYHSNVEQIMSLHNVCFTLQRFMRIVSSRLRPVMLFLDDLQWAGAGSLELIQGLLESDTRGSSCFFFVGSYRSNEVEKGKHPIFDLMTHLESSGVESTKLHLCGLSQDDLNSMIAESLCTFPRICKPLSDSVHAKTKGNPFFVEVFLRSLLDSAVLKYSLRERRWIWDIDKIEAENITDNALHLLVNKIIGLPENIQLTLKILSCFGIQADESIVKYFSLTEKYPDLWVWLNQAIREGFIQKIGSKIKFVHDKVREAAYSLIPENEKSQFHYNLGVLLNSVSRGKDLGGAIFHVIDQMNHGIPGLIQPTMLKDVIRLNFASGSKAMDRSDYKTAQSYFSNTFSLLAKNHWSGHYEFSLRLYFLSAKAAYSCGNIEKAYGLLKQILKEGCCLGDKLDAYYLYATILHACEERDEAYTICCEVMSQLDETIPSTIDNKKLLAMVQETSNALRKMSDKDLLQMKEMTGPLLFTLKFYSLVMCIAFWKQPHIMAFLGCRMISISLEHGVCEDTVYGMVLYSAVLCQQCKLVSDIREACRVGNIGMSMLKRWVDSSDILPKVTHCYYGFVALHTLPLQECSDNLRKGFEVGMSSGDSAVNAFYNSMHLSRIALLSGENLSAILKEIDYHLEVMMRFCNKVSMPHVQAYRETISILIDKGESTGPNPKRNYACPYIPSRIEKMDSNSIYALRNKENVYINRTMQSFWLGYSQRCYHYATKALEMQFLGRHNRCLILFYAALNAFRGVKNTNGNGSQFTKLRALYKDAMLALRTAKELSPWNFSNKVHILEAEMYSFERKGKDAISSYAAAITSSRSSNYVHEEGLACELAGLHYKKTSQTALDFFQRAKECYVQWGSQVKVESITQQMERLVLASNLKA